MLKVNCEINSNVFPTSIFKKYFQFSSSNIYHNSLLHALTLSLKNALDRVHKHISIPICFFLWCKSKTHKLDTQKYSSCVHKTWIYFHQCIQESLRTQFWELRFSLFSTLHIIFFLLNLFLRGSNSFIADVFLRWLWIEIISVILIFLNLLKWHGKSEILNS